MRLALSSLALAVVAGCGGSPSPAPEQPTGAQPGYPEVEPEELQARLEAGDPWVPSDKVRQDLYDSGVGRAHLAPQVCVDESGAVVWTAMSAPSEFPPLDDDLLAEIRGWHFQPGPAACTTLAIEYEQRD